MKTLGYRFERLIVELLDTRRKEHGLSEEKLGKLAYPDEGDPRRKIQAIRNVAKKDKPQRVTLEDLFCLSAALDMDPSRIIARALDMLEAEEHASADEKAFSKSA